MKTFIGGLFLTLLFLLVLAFISAVLLIGYNVLHAIGHYKLVLGFVLLSLVCWWVMSHMATKYELRIYDGAWYVDGQYDSLEEIDDRLDKLGEVVEDYKIKTVYKKRA